MTPVFAHGFSPRKLGFLKRFLQSDSPQQRVIGLKNVANLPLGGTLYLWGMTLPEGCAQAGKIIRVEDGFLRSAGLGAALAPPLSWVFDDLGLHLDPNRPSRLETILTHLTLTAEERQATELLRKSLIMTGVSKYNLRDTGLDLGAKHRPRLLVLGQVETDASIRWGAPQINTNLGLLRAVRAAQPEAEILYKPHPDVVAGLRSDDADMREAAQIADRILPDGDSISLFSQVDALHVMTSLAGFEALLRGLPVTCWGQPFYAGWGLTEDRLPLPRRHRKLDLDTLTAAALIHYPRYILPNGRRAEAPEVVALLAKWRAEGRRQGAGPLGRWLLRQMLRLTNRL